MMSTGGAQYWQDYYYKLPKKKAKCKLIIEYDVDWGTYTVSTDGTTKNAITQEQYESDREKRTQPVNIKFYQMNNKAVKALKKGKMNYKGQKSWNLKTGYSFN